MGSDVRTEDMHVIKEPLLLNQLEEMSQQVLSLIGDDDVNLEKKLDAFNEVVSTLKMLTFESVEITSDSLNYFYHNIADAVTPASELRSYLIQSIEASHSEGYLEDDSKEDVLSYIKSYDVKPTGH